MKRARKNARTKKKQKQVQWLRRTMRYGLGALLLFVLMNGIFGDNGYLAMRRTRADAEKMRKEIQQLNEENQHLAGDVRALKTDPAAVERVAREDMGLARPGELVFRLPDIPADNTTPPLDPPKK
jgi:cell division protein FtsB